MSCWIKLRPFSLRKSVRLFLQPLLLVTFLILFSGSVYATAAYQLGAGDVIRIHVYGEEDLSFDRMLVGDSGIIAYPFLGDINLKGLTLAELESALKRGLQPDYLIEPRITVSIVEYRPFFISGEVKKPGGYPFQPGITVNQAVAVANGFTERASKSKIYIVHDDNPSGQPIKVGLNHEVRPGDTITVEQSFF